MRLRRLTLLALALVGALVASVVATAGNRAAPTPVPAFTADELVAPSGDNWLGYNGNVYNQRYSTLSEINDGNVKNLKIAWSSKIQLPGLKLKKGETNFAEMSPVAYGGTLYMPDGRGNPWAIDGSSGERIWANRLPATKLVGLAAFGLLGRGAAIGDGKVYLAAADATIAAYNQLTGRLVWKKTMADKLAGHSFTNAVTYIDGKIVTGSSGGDAGAPGFIVALDGKTGKELWRFQAIPQKPSDPGWDTWPAQRAFNGGGAMWNQMSVDPELGLAYVGVGNPIPYSGLKRGKGDELFTDSIVALDVNTGKLKWYYQTTHHDIWDLDTTNATVLFDLKGRKLIAHAGKSGWVYILDRETGKPAYGIPEVKVRTNVNGRDTLSPTQPIPKGQPFGTQCPPKELWGELDSAKKPFKRHGCLYEPYDETGTTLTAPSALGGANWPPSAYSPDTGYLYICSKDTLATLKSVAAEKQKLTALGDFGQWEGGALPPAGTPISKFSGGRIVAMNMRNNRIAWQVKWPGDICYSGVATTAGNLVFVGRNDGHLEAYNAKTGDLLWKSPKLKAGVNAAPIVYTANGKQYVAVHAGGNTIAGLVGVKPMMGETLYAFALPG